METSTERNNEDIEAIKEMRKQLETRIETQHLIQQQRIASLQTIVPDLVSSLDLSLKVVSAFNGLHYTPIPIPPPTLQIPIPTLPNPNPHLKITTLLSPKLETITRRLQNTKPISKTPPKPTPESNLKILDGSGSPLSIVRSMVAVCLLERVPFSPMDSRAVLRKLESDQNATAEEKAALLELGGESGGISAVEMALRSMGEYKSGVELEEYLVSGKSRVLVLAIDRNRLVKELPESSQLEMNSGDESNQNQLQSTNSSNNNNNVVGFGMGGGGGGGGGGMMRPLDMWGDPHMSGMQPMFPPGMMFPRGGHRGMGMVGNMRGMAGGVRPLHRPPMGMSGTMGGGNLPNMKQRTEEDDMKDLEALLSKKSFREMQKSNTGKELLDLINRPTAKEIAVTAKFKSKGGSQVKEYCTALTKDDCRRQSGSYVACGKVHFRRIIALHTDMNLGDCSFLDTCRHMKTCKYVHYELDSSQDIPLMMMGCNSLRPPKPIKTQRAEYCSEVELGESQWINCDIRSFRMDILGQFGVIMADPPWDIHMELPYGTMADDEMRTLNVPALQTDGLIFLWVTGRAMELGRECLELWGYKRIEELIWVKTNQLQRIIRTGRTGHWLNHSKEHCLVGIKGNPEVNRNIDTDVLVAEVRETSRKPDEMYSLLERISPRTRKLELFARMHNTHAGWISLGNQLSGARLVDEGLRARFKAAYPEVEVQPSSPPRASAMEIDSNTTQTRSPFTGMESKLAGSQFAEPAAPEPYNYEEKPMNIDMKMSG